MTDKLLYGVNEVCSALSISRSTLYRLVRSGKFAQPLKVTDKKRAWKRQDLEEYIDTLECVELDSIEETDTSV